MVDRKEIDEELMKELKISKEELKQRQKDFKPLNELMKILEKKKDLLDQKQFIVTCMSSLLVFLSKPDIIGLCEMFKYDVLTGEFEANHQRAMEHTASMGQKPEKPDYLG